MRRIASITIAVAALLAGAPGAASADVYDDNPATASRGPGELYVFARAADGQVYARKRDNGQWGAWTTLGGTATSGPAAVAYGRSIDVFVRGGDGQVYENVLGGDDRWSGWTALGGQATSAPAAAARRGSTGAVDVAVRGTDNAIWTRAWVPSGWVSGWATLGGNLTSAPTVASQAPEVQNIWARGTDGAVYQRAWNGTAWSDWGTLGGVINGAPAAVSRTEPYVNVYARGAGNQLFTRVWNGGAWSDWLLLDARPLDSAPAAGGDGPGHEWVVARGGGGLLLKEWTSTAGWGGWQDLGPVQLPPAPPPPAPATAPPPPAEVDLETGLRCTPPGGRLRVSVSVRRPAGKRKPRVTKVVFFTKGKGRRVRVDRKAPFQVHIAINRPAGTRGRVYARVHYKRSAHGKVHRKVVSRRYVVCR